VQLKATGTYSDNSTKDLTSTVTWSSGDPSKAIISATSGLATGVAAGTSVITAAYTGATSGTMQATYTLTVAPPNLVSVVLTPDAPTLGINKTAPFYAIGTYTDSTKKDVSSQVTAWTSSDTSILQITAAGLAQAQNLQGTAQISATIPGFTITPVTVKVTATIFVYATNFDDDTVSQYSIANDGTLTPLVMGTVATDHQPFNVSVEPTGEFVYVSNWASATVSQYKIGTDGTLSKVGTGSVATGLQPNAVTIDPANKYAYVANLGESTISQYKIGLDGQLSLMSTPKVPAGPYPATIVLDPTEHFAYAGNWGANVATPPAGPSTISLFTVSQTDGSLAPMSGAAATIGSGSGPGAIAIDPSAKYLYVANFGDGDVGQYAINSDGTLSPLTNATVNSGPQPSGIAIDPTGHYVYVVNKGNATVSQFTIGSDGGLVPMTPASVPTGGTGTTSLTIDPSGKYVYATNRGDTTISQFTIGAGGALSAATTVQAGLHPTSIAAGY